MDDAPVDAVDTKSDRIELLKLIGVTVAWFLLTRYLVPLGDRFVPNDWKAMISLQTFRMLCQLVTLVAGVGLSFAILKRPREAIGLAAPRPSHLASTVLLSPAAFVASTYLALQIAMPTLLAELATRGPGASRQNAGELGRTLTQAPLLVVLLWGALLAAVGEELLFRGALWSALRDAVRLVSGPTAKPPGSAPESISTEAPDAELPPFVQQNPLIALTRGALPGTVATVGSAIIFGQMHADMPGGVGIVRIASTTLLGLLCGMSRQLSGTIWVPILLHLANNTLTIGSSRKWFAASRDPILEGMPNVLVIAAGTGLFTAAIVLIVWWRLRERRRVLARAETAEPAIEP